MSSDSDSYDGPPFEYVYQKRNEDHSPLPYPRGCFRSVTKRERRQAILRREERLRAVQLYSRIEEPSTEDPGRLPFGTVAPVPDTSRATQLRIQQSYNGLTTVQLLRNMYVAGTLQNRNGEEHESMAFRERDGNRLTINQFDHSAQKRLQYARQLLFGQQRDDPVFDPLKSQQQSKRECENIKPTAEQTYTPMKTEATKSLEQCHNNHTQCEDDENSSKIGRLSQSNNFGRREEVSDSLSGNRGNEVDDNSSTSSYHSIKSSTLDSHLSKFSGTESPDDAYEVSSKSSDTLSSLSTFVECATMNCEGSLGYKETNATKVTSYGYLKDLKTSIVATYQDQILFDTMALQILKKSARFVDRTVSNMEPSDGFVRSTMNKLTRFLNRKFVQQYNKVERKRKKFDSDDEDEVESQATKRTKRSN